MELRATQCVATVRKTGLRCQRMAYRGGTVCYVHGGAAPQVKRKAAQRVALASAILEGDPRPPWQVLLQALHASDVLMNRAVLLLGEGGSITTEQLNELTAAIERVARIAKTTFDARVAEAQAAQIKFEGQLYSEAMVKVILRMIDHFGLSRDAEFVGRSFAREEMLALDQKIQRINSGEESNQLVIEGTASDPASSDQWYR